MPPAETHAFRYYSRVHGNLGAETVNTSPGDAESDTPHTPFLGAEFGGGVPTMYRRRPIIQPDDIGAMLPVQQQSLAHALENMWLMATALGLGMHLVSATATMGDDPTFCKLLGLPVGEFALNGCAVGVPAQPLEMRRTPDAAAATTWLD